MNVYEVLKESILSKSPCRIAKFGEPPRDICPYRLGTSSKGVMNVIYYQFGGYTTHAGGLEPDGSSANWRCNHVADIETAYKIDGSWHEPNVKPKTRGYCVVYADAAVQY
jgi:hypothetical protein